MTSSVSKKNTARGMDLGPTRRVAAGAFKARCLALMREVADTGSPVLVTSRGEPLVEVFPARNRNKMKGKKKDEFLGRLEGIMKIVGDPDDLIKPIFPLEDYDMLK